MRRLVLLAALPPLLLLAACGEGDPNSADSDTLTIEGEVPADTGSIRDDPLTPATLKDPRIERLPPAEQRILQDYVSRGIRRDSLEAPDTRASLGGWLDSNLTVGEVIALYHGTEEIDPLPPEPIPQSPTQPGDEDNR